MAMLEVSADRLIHLHLSVHDVATYVTGHGWHQVPHSNQRLLIFQGPLDDCGNPIHLILPSQNDFGDSHLRLAEAVELLANIEERPSEAVLADIQNAVTAHVAIDIDDGISPIQTSPFIVPIRSRRLRRVIPQFRRNKGFS
jgi:hypothetical protein